MGSVAVAPEIRVGDHVRWTDPEMDLNVIWEVTSVTSKSYHLRCDVEQNGETRVKRRTARKEQCELIASQLVLEDGSDGAS